MKAEIAFLKNAAAHIEGAEINGCYIIRDGYIYAGNGPIMAGAPFDCDEQFAIPAEDLEAAVARMPDRIVLSKREKAGERGGTLVQVIGGKLRSTINCRDDEPEPIPQAVSLEDGPLDAWAKIPHDFAAKVGAAIPFAHTEGSWHTGIHVHANSVVAVSNRGAIQFDLSAEMPNMSLTPDAAKFIADNEPSEYLIDGNSMLFKWHDGRWLRCQMMAYDFPPSALELFSREQPTEVAVHMGWTDALEDACALAADRVELQSQRMIGRKGNSITEVAIKTDVPADHASVWGATLLTSMARHATHWNPAAHPEPAKFVGQGLRGLIIGTKF